MKSTCELHSFSNSIHLQQVYAGFAELHQAGKLCVTQKVERRDLTDDRKPPHLRDAREHHLRVVLNDKINSYYDLHDGAEIDEESLETSDFYFKRSFQPDIINSLPQPERAKVFPYGLNYLVYSAKPDAFLRARGALANNWREKAETKLRALAIDKFLPRRFYTPRAGELQAPPDLSAPPKILFMARAWNPQEAAAQIHQHQINQLNENRARCIRLLRREFGAQFYGGFAVEDYSAANFADCLLTDNAIARKQNYLKLLRDFPICVATTGLLGSIGWKFAEYVAYSKAIVSEPLNYIVPGDFGENRNYLKFETPESCLETIGKLIADADLRREIMENNHRYYHDFLKPDALVWRTIEIALTQIGKT